MKVLVLGIFCLLLVSCRTGGGDDSPKLHDFYRELSAADMLVQIRADFGDRTAEYRVRYSLSLDEERVTIVEPVELAEISVLVLEGGTRLEFDGLVLETGALPGTGLSPLEAIPFTVRTWRDGHITAQGEETLDGVRVVRAVHTSTYDGQSLQVVTWFDTETLHPLRSETYVDGTAVLILTFLTVTLG